MDNFVNFLNLKMEFSGPKKALPVGQKNSFMDYIMYNTTRIMYYLQHPQMKLFFTKSDLTRFIVIKP